MKFNLPTTSKELLTDAAIQVLTASIAISTLVGFGAFAITAYIVIQLADLRG